jgi:hypothetical protein
MEGCPHYHQDLTKHRHRRLHPSPSARSGKLAGKAHRDPLSVLPLTTLKSELWSNRTGYLTGAPRVPPPAVLRYRRWPEIHHESPIR